MSLLVLTAIVSVAVALGATGVAWRMWREERARATARVRALDEAIGGAPRDEPVAPALFSSAGADVFSGRRLGSAAGVGVAAVSAAAIAVLLFGGSSNDATKAPAPIDLVSMRHVAEAGDFVVTGLVRNPGTADVREGIDAVAYFFDGKGGFITSAKAPLEVAQLSPGGESPFRVKIPRPAGLERYRLSFRTTDGTVVPHVDRREAK